MNFYVTTPARVEAAVVKAAGVAAPVAMATRRRSPGINLLRSLSFSPPLTLSLRLTNLRSTPQLSRNSSPSSRPTPRRSTSPTKRRVLPRLAPAKMRASTRSRGRSRPPHVTAMTARRSLLQESRGPTPMLLTTRTQSRSSPGYSTIGSPSS